MTDTTATPPEIGPPPRGYDSWAEWARSGDPLPDAADELLDGAPDALAAFVAGSIAGVLSRDGYKIWPTTTSDGDYLPALLVAYSGHNYQVRVNYAGPLSIEQLAAIAARNGITLRPTGKPGEFIATSSRPAVPWMVAQHVMHTFEGHQYAEPGSFTTALIECIKRADPTNRRILAQLYPDYVRAVVMYQHTDGGRDELAADATPPPKGDD